MSKFSFKTEDNGYSIAEVDKYIERLQAEYRNAVEWGNEIKNSIGGVEAESEQTVENHEFSQKIKELEAENEALKNENKKQIADCRLLASKLRDLMQSNENAELSKASRIIDDAEGKALEIIADAERKAGFIIEGAEHKAHSILERVERECDSIIIDATQKIDDIKVELNILYKQKDALSEEIEGLISVREELAERMTQAKKLLDI